METELTPGMTEVHKSKPSKRTRGNLYVKWIFICGAGLYSAFHAGFVLWNTL